MAFRYSCFLSYQRGNDLLDRFARELFQALSNELGILTDLPVWFDTARLEAGDAWMPALSQRIIDSVCMVPILTPTYFSRERLGCGREYYAMEIIEKHRQVAAASNESIIIPVVLRGHERLPKSIVEKRMLLDFGDYLAFGSKQFRSPRFAKSVRSLAEDIFRLQRIYGDLELADTTGFAVPTAQDTSAWLNDLGLGAPAPVFKLGNE